MLSKDNTEITPCRGSDDDVVDPDAPPLLRDAEYSFVDLHSVVDHKARVDDNIDDTEQEDQDPYLVQIARWWCDHWGRSRRE